MNRLTIWLSRLSVLAIVSVLLVAVLYLLTQNEQSSNPYTQWTMGAAVVLFGITMFALGVFYVLIRVAGQYIRKLSSNKTVMTLLLVSLMSGSLIGQSCFGEYEQFTNKAWNNLESCIQDTNDDPWYMRLAIRSVCNANWISDAEQGMIDYTFCMSLDKIFGR